MRDAVVESLDAVGRNLPDGTRREIAREALKGGRMAEWKIRRGDDEFTAPDTATLQRWVAEGRVVPTDYVLNPTLGRWMYVTEAAELSAAHKSVESAKRGASVNMTCGAAAAMFLLAVMFSMWNSSTGALIFGVLGILFAVVWLVGYVRR
jgi:hypothetical protein